MNKVVAILGPTAAGKTDLALELAKNIEVQIISVDSIMVYRNLNIGSAKPSIDVLKKFPHKLVNILNPDEKYNYRNRWSWICRFKLN